MKSSTFTKERILMKRYVKASSSGYLADGQRVWTNRYDSYADYVSEFAGVSDLDKIDLLHEAQQYISEELGQNYGVFTTPVVTVAFNFSEPLACLRSRKGWLVVDVIEHESYYLKDLVVEEFENEGYDPNVGVLMDEYLTKNM